MRTTHRSRPLLVPLAVVACLACGAGSPHAVAEPRKHAGAGADEPLFHAELKDDAAVARAIREHYTKFEYRIPMRDGVHLFTSVYAPKDRSRTYPILLLRTPYGVAPYGADNYPTPADPRAIRNFAPSAGFIADGFIFVRQDVRGRMMSEGTFVDVRPHATGGGKTSVDESTDAWDTIDWLVKNVPNNNGRVGAWGISYPGFYAAQAAVNAHPALKAVSPQAPVTEWFLGDDFHHNGAFFFADAYDFYSNFGRPRPKPTTKTKWNVDHDGADIYDYFLSLGTLAKATSELETPIPFWNELLSHPNRDDWWKARDPRPWYKGAKPAIMTVGGWFDAEDLFGALATYRSYETQSPGAHNALVMGPWSHGGWARHEGDRLGDVTFGQKTSLFYREHIERPFFDQHLKGRAPAEPLPEAYVFETGTNVWQRFPTWPPADAKPRTFFFHEAHGLGLAPPAAPKQGDDGADAYVSDPAKPVPYRATLSDGIDEDYMTDDQRFATRRPDVLSYETPELDADLTVCGTLEASLWVTTTGTDADFLVKLVDHHPNDYTAPDAKPGLHAGGYQQLVRAEIMRGRFRNSFEKPEPFKPGEPALVKFSLPDTCHTFRMGHRVMIQVQSSWFPLVDRNPQTFVENIANAKPSDFRAASHRVLRTPDKPSSVTLMVRGPLPKL